MGTKYQWKSKPHCKFVNDNRTFTPTLRHPLEESGKINFKWTKTKEVVPTYDFKDPLGATNQEEDLQNLPIDSKIRSYSLANTLEQTNTDTSNFEIELPDFQPWAEKRYQIVLWSKPREFTLNKIEILKATLQQLSNSGSIKEVTKATDISQKLLLHRETILHLWNRNERVEALKAIADIVKEMESMDCDSIEFPYYWLQYVDIFEMFGKLVYNRLLAKSNEERNKHGQHALSRNFTSDQIPKVAKDMAVHWFLKIGEIQDLVPRFYVETSLISCLNFLDSSTINMNLERLATISGKLPANIFGLYSRVYISRTVMYIDPNDRTPHWRILHDYMQSRNDVADVTLSQNMNDEEIRKRNIKISALSWIVQCISYGAHSIADLAPLWVYCRKTPLDEKTFLLVCACVDGMPSNYISMHSNDVLDMIFLLQYNFEEPLRNLGRRYTRNPPILEMRKCVKRSVWLRIPNIPDFRDFLKCAVEWSSYIAKHCKYESSVKVLNCVVSKLRLDEKAKDITYSDDIINLMSAFLENIHTTKIIDLLNDPDWDVLINLLEFDVHVASKCAKKLLNILTRSFKRSEINDYNVCSKIIKYSISLCSYLGYDDTDEGKIADELVANSLALMNIRSWDDKMMAIDLLTKARGALGRRQIILQKIIEIMFDFTLHCESTISSSSKKVEFMRVCTTNIAITVPAVEDLPYRMRCFMRMIQLCIMINFQPQLYNSCDNCFETLENLVVSEGSCQRIYPFFSEFISLLCHVSELPGDRQPYANKILEFIEKYEQIWFTENRGIPFSEIVISFIRYLCYVRGFEDGDEFLGEIDRFIDIAMSKVLILANEPIISVIILENVVVLFEINEDVRSTIRSLLKRAVLCSKLSARLEAAVNDLQSMAKEDEAIMEIVQKLALD